MISEPGSPLYHAKGMYEKCWEHEWSNAPDPPKWFQWRIRAPVAVYWTSPVLSCTCNSVLSASMAINLFVWKKLAKYFISWKRGPAPVSHCSICINPDSGILCYDQSTIHSPTSIEQLPPTNNIYNMLNGVAFGSKSALTIQSASPAWKVDENRKTGQKTATKCRNMIQTKVLGSFMQYSR